MSWRSTAGGPGPGRADECPRCGGAVEATHAFCPHCGLKLADASAAAPEAVPERKQASILFADVEGSTAMLEGADPERSALLFDPILVEISKLVRLQHGLVGKLAGDGLKALFGIPRMRRDHAVLACLAALAIRDLARSHDIPLRIGVHSGEVVFRHLATDGLDDFDAVGLAVHIAARLEQAARPGTVLVSEATADLIGRRFSLKRKPKLTVKGVREMMQTFELQLALEPRGQAGRERRRHFVGRTVELAALRRALENEAVVSVSGQAGLGKTSLIEALLAGPDFADATLVVVALEPGHARTGLRPLTDLFLSFLRAKREESKAVVQERLTELVEQLGGVGEAELAVLQWVLGVAPSDMAAPTRDRCVGCVAELFRRDAERARIVVVFDDLHWLDQDARALLGRIQRGLEHARIRIVQTFRAPPPEAGLIGREIELEPLSTSQSRKILDQTMGRDPALSPLKSAIVARAEGVPLFVAELARLKRPVSADEISDAIPLTVQAVIGERLDRLPPEQRDVLRVLSVVGRESPQRLIRSVMACDEERLQPHLSRLAQDGFVRCWAERNEKFVAFTHILGRDVTYASIFRSARRKLHRTVLETYEELYRDQQDDRLDTLGRHAFEAQAWSRSVGYLHRAAEQAIARSSHAEAVAFVQLALRALSFDEASAMKARTELKLRLLLRIAHNAIGNYPERLANLQRCEALATELGATAELPSLWVSRSSVMLQLGQAGRAIELCLKAKRHAARHGNREIGVIAGYMLSRSSFYIGELRRSRALAVSTLRLLESGTSTLRHGGGFGSSRVMLLTQIAQSAAALGEFERARACAQEALTTAEVLGRAFDIALASYGVGVVHLYQGRIVAALRTLESGVEASRMGGPNSVHAALLALLSYAMLQAGRDAEAVALSREALAHPEQSLYFANWPRLFGAMIAFQTGDQGGALALAGAARKVSKSAGYRVQTVWADLILAHLHATARPRRARQHLQGALDESRACHARPCLARALLALAHQLAAAGDTPGAEAAGAEGRRLVKALSLDPAGDAPFFGPMN